MCVCVCIYMCIYIYLNNLNNSYESFFKISTLFITQGFHWSGKSQGNSRSGKSQGILEFVREIWNFVESQGNLRKVREI